MGRSNTPSTHAQYIPAIYVCQAIGASYGVVLKYPDRRWAFAHRAAFGLGRMALSVRKGRASSDARVPLRPTTSCFGVVYLALLIDSRRLGTWFGGTTGFEKAFCINGHQFASST